MTTGSNSSTNEMMKDGIRYVRDGRMADAYRTFREVVTRDPRNEHAWIWISQTSTDMAERRMAIDRAFEINPDSANARQALARLEQEEAAAMAAPPPRSSGVIGSTEARAGGGRVRLTPELAAEEDLRAAMGGRDEGNGRKKGKADKGDPRSSGTMRQNPQMVTQTTGRRRNNPLRLVSLMILILAILGLVIVVFIVRNQQQNQAATAPEATTAVTDTTTTGAGTTTPGVDTASANVTAAAATTAAATTETGNATAAGATTAAASTAAATTPAAATTETGGALAATPTPVVGASTPATSGPAGTAVAGTSGQTGVNTQVDQAQQLISQGNYKDALVLLSQAVTADPRSLSANFRLGAAYLAAPANAIPNGVDRFNEAINRFKRVTELAPTWPGGYARLGEAYAAKGDIPSAINAFSKSLELDPNGPERWLALASLYDRNNQPAEASYARTRAQGLNTPAATSPAAAPATSAAATTSAAPAPTPTVKR